MNQQSGPGGPKTALGALPPCYGMSGAGGGRRMASTLVLVAVAAAVVPIACFSKEDPRLATPAQQTAAAQPPAAARGRGGTKAAIPALPAEAFGQNRIYLTREKTATEISKTLEGSLRKQALFDKNVEDLFLNRWVPHPGWIGRISKLPEFHDNAWQVELIEARGSAGIFVRDIEGNLSNCRIGDIARIAGRIAGINSGGIQLAESVIAIDCSDKTPAGVRQQDPGLGRLASE